MAQIAVYISSITGGCTLDGYSDHLDAVSMDARIETPVVTSSGAEQSNQRNSGIGHHSDIMVARIRDGSSPLLAQACSAGTNLGTVFVKLIRQIEGTPQTYMEYVLHNTYVSHYDSDTVDANGVSYGPHFGPSNQPSQPSSVGPASETAVPRTRRLAPLSATGAIRGPDTTDDIERVWLNGTLVEWRYTPFVNGVSSGNIERFWSIELGRQAS